ncbi:hypothetical protein N8I77_006448 [Diaporthe amygdali]|uniref:Myb-like DNA-binding domain-containing protein n=1 Tax=Phomopsis amygdali TaxID=1214568 RepID=A0AAD9SI88_PHOAM|nr:hypothetical protein N8I77_006448 [Diaporthe amygdali]
MAPIDTESQFKFLIACIKHTNAGKVDFGKVSEELSIVSKGAAAKRYERLMKAHGIDKTNGSGASSPGPSGPSTPKTPASGRKNANSRATPASKKRKLAARVDDVDDDDDVKPEVKPEIKEEVKQELDNVPDGSYMIDPNKPSFEAPAAGTLLHRPDGAEHTCEGNDDVLLVSESRREENAAPVAFAHQVLLPPPPENFYGFVDPATHLHHPSQPPAATTGVPICYEYGNADYTTQAMTTLPSDGHHWLHHHDPAFFWSDARLEPQVDMKHD